MRNWYRRILAKIEEERAAEERALELRIAGGPPDKRISQSAWETWCRYEFVACPGWKGRYVCKRATCQQGLRCENMGAIGLLGTGEPLPKRERVRCGAMTRQGHPCAMTVVPGKARCRLHGGLSSGPKTPEGRARIAAAQKRRWEKLRASSPEPLPAPAPLPSATPETAPPARRSWRRKKRLSGMAL